MNDKWRDLIDNPPKGLDAIADLFDLSTDYEYPTPATLFIDLIGYTTEEHGEVLVKDITVIWVGSVTWNSVGSGKPSMITRIAHSTEKNTSEKYSKQKEKTNGRTTRSKCGSPVRNAKASTPN
jgi:hypothetical protein